MKKGVRLRREGFVCRYTNVDLGSRLFVFSERSRSRYLDFATAQRENPQSMVVVVGMRIDRYRWRRIRVLCFFGRRSFRSDRTRTTVLVQIRLHSVRPLEMHRPEFFTDGGPVAFGSWGEPVRHTGIVVTILVVGSRFLLTVQMDKVQLFPYTGWFGRGRGDFASDKFGLLCHGDTVLLVVLETDGFVVTHERESVEM
jgi:hypothetical protein